MRSSMSCTRLPRNCFGKTSSHNAARTRCLALGLNGRQTAEIAKALELGEETARSHLKKAQGKLGARNRTQAVAEPSGSS